MNSLRPISITIATLAFATDLYASKALQHAPSNPRTPRKPPISRVEAYLRRDQELGSGAYTLEPAGELPDIEPPTPQQNNEKRTYGSRKMGEMSYERSSSLPKPTE